MEFNAISRRLASKPNFMPFEPLLLPAFFVGVSLVEGDAPEHQPPARQLSPMELLAMKNKEGYTPVIKAFAGGVHVSVIRYVWNLRATGIPHR